MEPVAIGKSLDASRFPDSKVTNATVITNKHVLPAGNTMVPGFKRFCGKIQWTSRMPGIGFRAILEAVVRNALCFLSLRIGQP